MIRVLVSRVLVSSLMLALADLHAASAAPDPSALIVRDVSPDTPFGDTTGGMTTSGRVIGVAVALSDESVVYAASEWMGVWKSVDGAHTWLQSSNGLRSGITQNGGGPVIAADAGSDRLLYITQPVDGRTTDPCTPMKYQCGHFGGLWASSDAAASWRHVAPPGCLAQTPYFTSVGFSGGAAFVLADDYGCRLTSAADAGLKTWSSLPDPPFAPFGDHMVSAQGATPVLFACQGKNVYRTTSPQTGIWEQIALPSGFGYAPTCAAVASLPASATNPPGSGGLLADTAVVLASAPDGQKTRLDAFVVDFRVGAITAWLGQYSDAGGSGIVGLWTAPFASPTGSLGAGLSYDVFAADGLQLWKFAAGNNWSQIPGLHVDTWSMSFPSSYDPPHGACTGFASNDGGVYAGCDAGSSWVLASAGLRLLWVNEMEGVSRPFNLFTCGFQHPDGTPCPVLYLPSTDDDQWVSDVGGVSILGSPWKQLGDALGDAGETLIDPSVPTMGLALRNGNYQFKVSGGSAPPDSWAGFTDITPENAFIGSQDGLQGGIVQVRTSRGASYGADDFFALASPRSLGEADPGPDRILRNRDVGDGPPETWSDWAVVSSLSPEFGPGNVAALAASGGHENTVLYVLTTDSLSGDYGSSGYLPSHVYKGTFSAGAPTFTQHWSWASGFGFPGNFLQSAYSLVVNPYDPNELWATDLGDGSIRVSRDGGQVWSADPVLKDVATNHGEFDFDCGNFPFGHRNYGDKQIFGNQCPLMQILFPRDVPKVRVAVLYPGGVAFSRDEGHHWIPLNVTRESAFDQPIQLPISAFYDPASSGNASNKNKHLFVGLEGRGLLSVEGPFDTLESGRITYCPICVLPNPGTVLRNVHAVVDSPFPQNVPMRPIGGGLYQGDFVFDAAKTTRISYRVMADRFSSPRMTQDLTAADLSNGVAALTALPPATLSVDVLGTGPDWLELRFRNDGTIRLATVELRGVEVVTPRGRRRFDEHDFLGALEAGASVTLTLSIPSRGAVRVRADVDVVDDAGRNLSLSPSTRFPGPAR